MNPIISISVGVVHSAYVSEMDIYLSPRNTYLSLLMLKESTYLRLNFQTSKVSSSWLLPLVENHKTTPKSDFVVDVARLTNFTIVFRIKIKLLFHYRYKP